MIERVILAIIAAIFIGYGSIVLAKGPRLSANRYSSLAFFSIAIWVLSNFWESEPVAPQIAALLLQIDFASAVLIMTGFLLFSLNFPFPLIRAQFVKKWLWVPAVTLVILSFSDRIVRDIGSYQPGVQLQFKQGPLFDSYSIYIVGTLLATYIILFRRWRTAKGLDRNRLAYVFFGILSTTLIAVFINLFLSQVFPLSINVSRIGVYGVLLLGGSIALAIVRYRLMNINLVLTRAAIFTFCFIPILLLPIFLTNLVEPVLLRRLGPNWWILPTLTEAFVAAIGMLVYRYIREKADDKLLAEQRRYQAALRQASQGMTLIKELNRLLRLLVHFLTRTIGLKNAAIYLWDAQIKKFILKTSRHKPKEGQVITIELEDPMIQYLHRHRAPIDAEELQWEAKPAETVTGWVLSSLKRLGATVVVPSFVEEHCVGFLVLGEKISGALYTTDDLQVLQVLANQAALAIENAQFYEELKRTQADLFQTAKMASLGHMAGGMSHQINNRFHVLTVLAGTMKAAMKDVTPPSGSEKFDILWAKIQDSFRRIEENSLRGGDIVKTLLRFSRPAGGYKRVEISQIISTALEVIQFKINMEELDIVREIPPDLPPVKGDLNQLADSVFNLISNAFDAMQKKKELIQSGQLAPSPKDPIPFRDTLYIRGRIEQQDGQKFLVILETQDNGVGMRPQDIDSLFIPFFTTKASTDKGTGLGLYVIQRILEQHGGTISATSSYGVGTIFRIQLPAYEEEIAQV